MDPVNPIGALANAIQLLDVSVKSARQLCSFFHSVKNARDDVYRLQQTLEETNSLMQDLQIYATKLQQSPSIAQQQQEFSRSIVKISQLFADDIRVLQELLPSHMQLSISQRFKQALSKTATECLIQRLEKRKLAVIMSLGIASRITDIKNQDNLDTLYAEIKDTSLRSNALFEVVKEQNEAILSHLQRQNDNIQARFQTDEYQGSLSQLETRVVSAIQDLGISISKTTFAAENPDGLGRIIRAELKQQLQPFLQLSNGLQQEFDHLSLSIAGQSSKQSLFHQSPDKTTNCHGFYSPPDASTEHESLAVFQGGNIAADYLPKKTHSGSEAPTTFQSKSLRLFSGFHQIKTSIGVLHIQVITCRSRCFGFVLQQPQTFFQLKIDFLPKRWLSTRGLSAIYSSGPNVLGYYDILPRIQTYRIFEDDSTIYELLRLDDATSLRRMVEENKIGFRDVNENGSSLLRMAVHSHASSICRYLLQESGYEELVLDADNLSSESIWQMITDFGYFRLDIVQSTREILSLLQKYPEISDGPLDSLGSCWHNLYLSAIYLGWEFHESITAANLFLKYKASFHPFVWYGTVDMAKNEYLLKVYLETRGNPNELDEHGCPPLLIAMICIHDFLEHIREQEECEESERGEEEDEGDEGDEEDEEDDWENEEDTEETMMTLARNLLVLLISAGADIYYIVGLRECYGCAQTLTDISRSLNIDDIWEEALDECGFDIEAVYIESDRRLQQHKKLHGAIRTGVDVQALAEESTLGLRYRARETRVTDEV